MRQPSRRADNKVDQFTYRAMTFNAMAQVEGSAQFIAIALPFRFRSRY